MVIDLHSSSRYKPLMNAKIILILFFLFPFPNWASTPLFLDSYVSSLQRSERRSESELYTFAKELNVKIEKVSSVSRRVLKLPFNPRRMKISADDQLEGWFDEYSSSNLIIIEKKATVMTLVHELRHAIHLGAHHPLMGNKLDRQIEKAKAQAKNFEEGQALIENASEIVAHTDELKMAEGLGDQELQESAIYFRKEYLKEFKKRAKALRPLLTKETPELLMLEKSILDFYQNSTLLK